MFKTLKIVECHCTLKHPVDAIGFVKTFIAFANYPLYGGVLPPDTSHKVLVKLCQVAGRKNHCTHSSPCDVLLATIIAFFCPLKLELYENSDTQKNSSGIS